MKKPPAFRCNFLNFRVLGAWFLSSVAILLAVYAFGAFPAASALGQAASQNQNPGTPPLFKGMVGEHGTRGDPSLPAAQSGASYPQELEEAIPSVEMASTHSSFLAGWDKVSGATGYRLDVSTSSSFSSYVSGYQDLNVGNVTNRIVSGLSSGTTYYYRVRPYTPLGTSGSSNAATAATAATVGLVINPTFDSTITTNPNSAAIQSMINQAIAIYQSLFRDPITVSILFRYSNTGPNGAVLPSGRVSQSNYYVYFEPWNTYINALKADAKTGNDTTANASLPASALPGFTNIDPSSAGGRAIGLNTPGMLSANGSVGGSYDGIVTLNSAYLLQFTRPPSSNHFDAREFTEHEIDEVLGFGSHLNLNNRPSDLRPQDLFSWAAAGTRNTSSTGTRYFSINGGTTNIVGFNQTPPGDFGDWLSPTCPQASPHVQNAFNCAGQYSDVSASSPEGINLDVIGYDRVTLPNVTPYRPSGWSDKIVVSTVTGTHTDALYLAPTNTLYVDWAAINNGTAAVSSSFSTQLYVDGVLKATWNSAPPLNINSWVFVQDYNLGSLSVGTHTLRIVADSGNTVAEIYENDNQYTKTIVVGPNRTDFSVDGKSDYLQTDSAGHTRISYLSGAALLSSVAGPTIPAGWSVASVNDFNRDGKPDLVLFKPSTRQTSIWYLNNATYMSSAAGPTLPAGWVLRATADFNKDGKPDLLLFNPTTLQTRVWYLNGTTFLSSIDGPTLTSGWTLVCANDFNGDGKPDYLLVNAAGNTKIWTITTLNGASSIYTSAAGPTIPAGWQLVSALGDYNGDKKPDWVLFNPTTLQTAIWYMNGAARLGSATGPTLPAGFSVFGR